MILTIVRLLCWQVRKRTEKERNTCGGADTNTHTHAWSGPPGVAMEAAVIVAVSGSCCKVAG